MKHSGLQLTSEYPKDIRRNKTKKPPTPTHPPKKPTLERRQFEASGK